MGSFVCLLLCFLLIIGCSVLGAEVQGTADSIFMYSRDLSQFRSQLSFDLRYIQGFGYTSKLMVHPVIRYQTQAWEQGVQLEIKEAYFDLYLDSLDLRMGKQLVNWGSSYLISPLNIVNPLNLEREDPTQMQLGVWGATGKYYFDYRTELTGVIVGIFEPTRVPARIREAKTQEMEEELVRGLLDEGWTFEAARERVADLESDVDFPIIDQWQEAEYGLQLTRRGVGAFDLSLCYYEGYEDQISLRSDLEEVVGELARGDGSEPRLELEFKRAKMLGASVVGYLGPVGVWSEGAWHRNDQGEQRLEGVLGADWILQNGLHTVLQLYHSQRLISEDAKGEIKDNVISGIATEETATQSEGESYLMLMNQLPFQRIHRLQSTFIYDWQEQGYLISPELRFSLQTNLSLCMGAVCKGGQVSSLIASLGEEKYYVKLTYGF